MDMQTAACGPSLNHQANKLPPVYVKKPRGSTWVLETSCFPFPQSSLCRSLKLAIFLTIKQASNLLLTCISVLPPRVGPGASHFASPSCVPQFPPCPLNVSTTTCLNNPHCFKPPRVLCAAVLESCVASLINCCNRKWNKSSQPQFLLTLRPLLCAAVSGSCAVALHPQMQT